MSISLVLWKSEQVFNLKHAAVEDLKTCLHLYGIKDGREILSFQILDFRSFIMD